MKIRQSLCAILAAALIGMGCDNNSAKDSPHPAETKKEQEFVKDCEGNITFKKVYPQGSWYLPKECKQIINMGWGQGFFQIACKTKDGNYAAYYLKDSLGDNNGWYEYVFKHEEENEK
jgi:hypothetical protein